MSAPWQSTPPDVAGRWEMRSDETRQEPQAVLVFEHEGELWVEDPDVGTNLLLDYHHNLCSVQWRRCDPDKTTASMSTCLINMAVAEHQAAFWETHGGWPAMIHVAPEIVAALAASPWRVHFDQTAYQERGEGYLAHSRLLPVPGLPASVMWSPLETVPPWCGEH